MPYLHLHRRLNILKMLLTTPPTARRVGGKEEP